MRGIEDYAARDVGLDNLITADDLARLLVALAEGRLAGPAATAACEETLLAQEYRDGIPAGLPPGVVVGNKTGWVDGVNHDVALVRSPGLPAVGLAVLVSVPGTPEEREAGIAPHGRGRLGRGGVARLGRRPYDDDVTSGADSSVWRRFEHDPRDPAYSGMRASDRDRAVVHDVLAEAYAEGRLDRDELDERVGSVDAAKTYADLLPPIRDLTADVVPATFASAEPVGPVAPPDVRRSGRAVLPGRSATRSSGC